MNFWAAGSNSTGGSEAWMKQDWNTGEGSLGERGVDGLTGVAPDWADF